jgi:hypothetical protein
MNSRNRVMLAFVALLIPLTACGGPTAGPTAPGPVTLVASNLTINGFRSLSKTGETGRLNALVTYSDGTVQDKSSEAQWSSANQNVAIVDSSGMVTAIAEGHTLVTATFANVSGTRMIQVDLP